jgi:hypothetical protein
LNGFSMPVEGVELTVFFACPYIAAMKGEFLSGNTAFVR